MKRLTSLLFVLLIFTAKISAQELNCQVQVLSPQIQGTNEKRIFDNLQKALYEFMNTTKWTNDIFSVDERINCTFILTISDKLATDQYKGSLQILSNRPIYKSSYNSVLFNQNDADVQFNYVEFQPLEFSISQNLNNLTSIMAFYAYVVIASDYDSYSLYGGTPYWQKAQTIVANCQNAAEKGWKSSESTKNRFWIADNMLQPTFAPIRECSYKYHRLGFDVMYQDVNGGRATCLEALQLLEKVHEQRPLSFPMQIFFNAKQAEVVFLFSGGLPDEKTKAVTLLQKIDPGNGIKYQKITQPGN
jgi:hypothetical protein